MISIKVTSTSEGDVEKYLAALRSKDLEGILDKYGQIGVQFLSAATPVDTGKTAASWDYRIEKKTDSASIVFTNSNRNKGECIAILIQYGHGTGWGGYVQGIDYINPALAPVFESLKSTLTAELKAV